MKGTTARQGDVVARRNARDRRARRQGWYEKNGPLRHALTTPLPAPTVDACGHCEQAASTFPTRRLFRAHETICPAR